LAHELNGGRMRFWKWLVLGVVTLGLAFPALAQRKTPYYVSIKAEKARMRTGPGRNYPSNWLYQRKGLPLKVIAVYEEWRKVEDPDGTQGRVSWRAAPGVVGRVSRCSSGWCWFDVAGRGGYVEQSHIWGTEPGEALN
jgi:SH3-like domain-containing protein